MPARRVGIPNLRSTNQAEQDMPVKYKVAQLKMVIKHQPTQCKAGQQHLRVNGKVGRGEGWRKSQGLM